jgi:hypothetical protein
VSTNHVPVEPSRGERHDMTHAGGRSLAEERLGEEVAILMITRRRKPCTEGFLETNIMSVPGVEPVGEQHHGMALIGILLRRQDTSPGGWSTLGRQGG